jgi:tetratricopeptide (TPR) repeat protein
MSNGGKSRRFHLTQEPVILTVLALLAVGFFLAVTGLSHAFFRQQQSLGNRWFNRGVTDLKAGHYQPAVSDFRTALQYSRDGYEYQLKLAEALIREGRNSEASAYLVNLWEREPENGLVNLDLARIAVQKGDREQTIRYYHNAIYATWSGNQPGNQEGERREARLELIAFLLGMGDRAQAQSELIALAANLEDDPVQHVRAGELFFEVDDYEHSLAEYGLVLKTEPRDAAALAGAGRAAFELGRYAKAEQYFEAALEVSPGDTRLDEELKETELTVRMDPFRRQISFAQRSAIVTAAFAAAGERMKACAAVGNWSGISTAGTGQSLAGAWTKMKPQITELGLRRNPELVEAAMELVFEIERRSSAGCGAPSATDKALLRISKLRTGNS